MLSDVQVPANLGKTLSNQCVLVEIVVFLSVDDLTGREDIFGLHKTSEGLVEDFQGERHYYPVLQVASLFEDDVIERVATQKLEVEILGLG